MTVQEAIKHVQGKGAGLVNRASARYAQTLIRADEEVTAAVVANIATRQEQFPGVVVITDQRVIAACGLPGIKRSITLNVEELEQCEETDSVLHYKVTFMTQKTAFYLTVNPDIGAALAPYIAALNGEEFEDLDLEIKGAGLFNPTFLRSSVKKRRAKAKARAEHVARQRAAEARFDAERAAENAAVAPTAPPEDPQTTADRLQAQLRQAQAAGAVSATDPQAVAARLAAELAEEEAARAALEAEVQAEHTTQ